MRLTLFYYAITIRQALGSIKHSISSYIEYSTLAGYLLYYPDTYVLVGSSSIYQEYRGSVVLYNKYSVGLTKVGVKGAEIDSFLYCRFV